MQFIFPMTTDGIEPEVSKPEKQKIIDGDPVHKIWSIDQLQLPKSALYAGLWHSTVGAWRIDYKEWEYFRIRSGKSEIRSNSGDSIILKAGDSYVIQSGFQGIWRVIEDTLKDYVILE